MELRNLLAFVEVIRKGGFSLAADTLCKSQPAVSRTIKQLEEELGTILVERMNDGVRLTSAGEIVYRKALNILSECESITLELDRMHGIERQQFRLGLPVMGGSLLFAHIFARFYERYPRVEVTLIERDTADLPAAVLNGEVDLAFTIRPFQHEFAAIDACDEPAVVALWRGHHLGILPNLTLADLADEPFIMPDTKTAAYGLITTAFARRGLKPRIAAMSRQLPFMLALVAQEMGVAIIPRLWATQNLGPAIRTVPLCEDVIRWRGCFVWLPNTKLSSPAQAWIEMVAEEFQIQQTQVA